MLRKIVYVLLALVALPHAMEAQVMFRSIEDVWHYADTHNITMRTARYEVEKATNAKRQAYGALLPQATTGGSFTDNTSLQTTLIPAEIFGGPPGTYRAVQFGQKYIYAGSVSAQMDILNLESWFNVQIAKKTEALSKDSLASVRKAIYQQLATQYYSYLLMKEAARLAGQSAAIADSVYESANNKYKEGAVNEGNLDVAKINLERARQTNTTAQYQMLTAKNNLKALLNLSLSDSLDINETLSDNIQIDEAGAFGEDPAIRLALRRMEISQSEYRLSKSAFMPTLSILYNKSTQQNDNKFEPFAGGAPWFQAEYWTLRASFPIFTGGTRWFQAKRSKLTYYESRLQYEAAQKQSAISDENLRLAYRKSVTLFNQSNNIMQLSFDNYQHASYRYESGIAPIDDRLNAFNDYISYQNQYLNNLSDMLVQLYQVKIRQQSF